MRFFQNALKTGIILLFIGFILVFLGTLFSSGESNSGFGGLILIGPIPIAFGSSPAITSTMLWAGVVLAFVYLFMYRRVR
ncbi:hypothetical protein Mpsy_2446 [Methanolobus psychrophilus R15]|nr:hypothetical protein Mpsy_2446 [Methanolobus psychrophilus R15]